MIRTVTLPHLHLFGIEDGLELQVSLASLLLLIIIADLTIPSLRSRSEEQHPWAVDKSCSVVP